MKIRKCTVCMREILVSADNEPGDILYCEGCDQSYELLSVKPLRLTPLDFYEDYEYEEPNSSYF